MLYFQRPNWSYKVDIFLSFHCLPHPPFGWDQHFPIPFNCQQVPFLHVTVNDVLKATGKQKGWISPRWCRWIFPKHKLCWGKFNHLENLLFILCKCIFAENKGCILIHQLLINVLKTKFYRLFKHWTSKQTSANSMPVLHITHYGLLPSKLHSSQNSSFSPPIHYL